MVLLEAGGIERSMGKNRVIGSASGTGQWRIGFSGSLDSASILKGLDVTDRAVLASSPLASA